MLKKRRSKASLKMSAIDRERERLDKELQALQQKKSQILEVVTSAPKRRERQRQEIITKRRKVTPSSGARAGGFRLNANVAGAHPMDTMRRRPLRRERRMRMIQFIVLLGVLLFFLIVLWQKLPS